MSSLSSLRSTPPATRPSFPPLTGKHDSTASSLGNRRAAVRITVRHTPSTLRLSSTKALAEDDGEASDCDLSGDEEGDDQVPNLPQVESVSKLGVVGRRITNVPRTAGPAISLSNSSKGDGVDQRQVSIIGSRKEEGANVEGEETNANGDGDGDARAPLSPPLKSASMKNELVWKAALGSYQQRLQKSYEVRSFHRRTVSHTPESTSSSPLSPSSPITHRRSTSDPTSSTSSSRMGGNGGAPGPPSLDQIRAWAIKRKEEKEKEKAVIVTPPAPSSPAVADPSSEKACKRSHALAALRSATSKKAKYSTASEIREAEVNGNDVEKSDLPISPSRVTATFPKYLFEINRGEVPGTSDGTSDSPGPADRKSPLGPLIPSASTSKGAKTSTPGSAATRTAAETPPGAFTTLGKRFISSSSPTVVVVAPAPAPADAIASLRTRNFGETTQDRSSCARSMMNRLSRRFDRDSVGVAVVGGGDGLVA